jgi:hypothetical protein
MFSFFQDDFAKPEIGHFFCPFFTFPKKSWKKKYTFPLSCFKYNIFLGLKRGGDILSV